MPNEIKAPKVLKETVKEVYNFMKAERLVEGFDRKTILRLIIEALSPEEINAMITAGRKGDKDPFKNLMKKYHPDRNKDNPEAEEKFKQASTFQKYFMDDDNKDNFDTPKLWPTEIQNIMKNAGVTGKPTGDQQAQGDQKDIPPEVKQTIAQIAKKYYEKYNPLFQKLIMVINLYTKQPEKFFQDQKFIDDLVQIAGSLKEAIDSEIEKELGLQPGKTKENLEKIVAGLEKIRNALVQALSKKGEESKNRPQRDKPNYEPGQIGGEEEKRRGELDDDPKQLSEEKEAVLVGAQMKQLLKIIRNKKQDGKKVFANFDEKAFKQVIKDVLGSSGINYLKEYLDKSDWVEKFKNANVVAPNRVGRLSAIVAEFMKKMKEKHPWPAPGEKGTSKQEARPMALVPGSIEKIEGNALTIQGKDGGDPITVSKEEAKATYDIITAATKFRKIFAILMQYLFTKAPEEVKKQIPNIQDIEPTPDPDPPTILIGNTPEEEDDDDDEKGEVKPVTGDDGMRYPRKALLEKYTELLEFNFDEFERSFLNVPMLNIQSKLYADLEDGLIAFKKEADNMGGAISAGEKDTTRPKPASEPAPSGKRDDLYEQLVSKVYNLITERTEVDFDEEGMSLFKTEYKQLLKLAKFLNQKVEKVDKDNLEKVGGDELVRQIRKIAEMLQESIGKVHDVVLNELRMDVEAGKKLTEEEGDETPPTDETPKDSGIQDPTPYDAHDTEGEAKRVQANKRSWEQKVKDVKNVYERVVNQLTLLNQLLESNEPRIEARKVNQLIQTSLKSLDSIRTFFPSQSPFGKRMPEGTSPDKYIKEMKRKVKQVVRDVIDIARQLKSTISNKPALQEEIQGVFKDLTDKQNVHKFAAQLKMTSAMLQDYFDAPSKIGSVFANRSAKITNPEKAASINDEGAQAAKTGKAEQPEYEKQEETKQISSHSQAVTKLKSYENVLKDIFSDLSDQQGKIKEIKTIGGKAFTSALVVLLNDFSSDKEKVQEEVGAKLSTAQGAGFEVFGMDKEKIKIINDLIKIDQTGGLSLFMYALQKDGIGATALKKKIDQKLKGLSFNLDFNEMKKFYKTKEKEPQEKDDKGFEDGKEFGDKLKGMFKEEIEEQLVSKLEPLIELYINNRKLNG
jgi:curved DNA-binding protein CbpA